MFSQSRKFTKYLGILDDGSRHLHPCDHSQKSEVNWPTCLSFACIKNLHTPTKSDQKNQEPNILIPKCI